MRVRSMLRIRARLIYLRLRYGRLATYLKQSSRIPGYTRGAEAVALSLMCYRLPAGAVVVEIGAFLGSSTVLLAGARKLRGSGEVHCIDPFDASGDPYSVPSYRAVASGHPASLRERLEDHIRQADLVPWVTVHQGTAESVSRTWRQSVDMIYLDGDQSPEGARRAYDCWAPFLKVGGIMAIHNSSAKAYEDGHDGQRRLVLETVRPPAYHQLSCAGTVTFARKVQADDEGLPS